VTITNQVNKPIQDSEKILQVGVVGCGLIGRRRAQVAVEAENAQLVAVADIDAAAAKGVGEGTGAWSTTRWQEIVDDPAIDVVVVATPNKFLMPVSVAALQNGKHVLCEKPPGRNASETRQMAVAAQENDRVLKAGFNHRYHPAVWRAHELLEAGEIGEVMYGRAVYGHGGRPGYDQEWRATADLSGGGEMLDQGVHIVDLFRWFMGEFSTVLATAGTYYWSLGSFENGRQLEDNAFAMLQTEQGQIAQLHTSWTQWKNRFSFEIFGQKGYFSIDGLGGSYGVETLTLGRRRPESGPPIIEEFVFKGPDDSWKLEWTDFSNAILNGGQPLSNGDDALRTMEVIGAFYESTASAGSVKL